MKILESILCAGVQAKNGAEGHRRVSLRVRKGHPPGRVQIPGRKMSILHKGISNNLYFQNLNWNHYATVPNPYPCQSTQAVWFALLHSHSRKGNLRKNARLDANSV